MRVLQRVFFSALLLGAPGVLLSGCAKEKADPTKLPELHSEPGKAQKISFKADPGTAPFVAAKHAKVYHKRDCPYAVHLDSPVGFNSVQEAEYSGHIPCQFCTPSAEQPAP